MTGRQKRCIAFVCSLMELEEFNLYIAKGTEENEGHLYFCYFNCSDHDIEVKKGDVIGQVVFMKYLTVEDDNATGERKGGFGSTDK